jgi:glycerate kinase
MIRVLAAPDKFRGTATADEVCAAIAGAVHTVGGTCTSRPMADGGEGMLAAFGGANRVSTVTGPLGRPVPAGWRLGEDGLAIIESAQACGLLLAGGAVGNDAVRATTRGVGELIVQARDQGATRILIGLGGSASTDGGFGCVEVMSAARGSSFPPMDVCCDVETRFTDAAKVFGPQKGAGPDDIVTLTERLVGLRGDYLSRFGVDVESVVGSGAAGGLAGGLAAVGAHLVSGFDRIADELGLDDLIAQADLVITGEGSFDATSMAGKVVGGVWRRAQRHGVQVLAVVGVAAADQPARPGLHIVSLTERFGREQALQHTTVAITRAVTEYLGL